MRSIQSDLENVERQLSDSSTAAAGRSFFNSIRSALSSIRSRLESSQPEQEGPTASATLVSLNLWDRLRLAELAHSARVPLHRLQNELAARPASDDSLSSSARSTSSHQKGGPNLTIDDSDCISPRRTSSLLASRRREQEVQGPEVDMDLHGTTVMQTRVWNSSDTIEIVFEDDDEMKYDDSERPPLLLTEKSRSSLDLVQQSVLFPEQKPQCLESMEKTTPSSATVYSWGPGVNSLHDHAEDVTVDRAKVDKNSRVGRHDIVSCSLGNHHVACVTRSGQLLVSGSNTTGEVDPDQKDVARIVKPVTMESLLQAHVVQVSCGLNHTAALRSYGSVLTWGGNEFGQLGHYGVLSSSPVKFCRPSIMALGGRRRATSVACGDGFTLCLTSRMEVLACGVEDIVGYVSEESRRIPTPVPALQNLPVVSIAAGRRHAVVLTTFGTAFSWGDNSLGSCGQQYPKHLMSPVAIKTHAESDTQTNSLPPPLVNWTYQEDPMGRDRKVAISDEAAIVQAACGNDHTVLVTRTGGLFVFGSNLVGQLGKDRKTKILYCPETLEHPKGPERRFVQATAGAVHTLLLDDLGDVWQMGGSDTKEGCVLILAGQRIQTITAGGDHNVALSAVVGERVLVREISGVGVTMKAGGLPSTDSLEDLLSEFSAAEDNMLTNASEANNSLIVTKSEERTEELFRTPAVLNGLFRDTSELEELFAKLLGVDIPGFRKSISFAIEKGMHKGLESTRSDDVRLMWPEQVRFLLLYLQCPLFVDWKSGDITFDRRGDLMLSLCDTILGLPYEAYKALMVWATSAYSRDQFVRLLLRPLLSQLQKSMSVDAGAERRPLPAIVSVLRWLYNASERAGNVARPEDFYSDAISTLNAELLFHDLQRYKNANEHQRKADFFFSANSFLFSPKVKRNLLHIENEVSMLKTASAGLRYNFEERTYEFNPYFIMDIDRSFLLQQTLQKISAAESSDLRKKLRVVFKGEDAVDGGGVTRELFQLLTESLFDINTGMWSTRFEDGDITWFNGDCTWNDEGFFLSGVLVGLAIYNSVLLDVHFPQAVYRKLLGLPLGLEDMVDQSIKTNMQQLLDYKGDDVEDVFCLTFAVNWTVFGQDKVKELKPDGSQIPVTSDNKEEFVLLYVRWLLVDSVAAQYELFESGFMKVMEDSSLDLFRPEELELLAVGSQELDFDELAKNTTYEGGYDDESPVVRNFWKFVKNAPKETQLNLLKFTTGSERAPIGGLGAMYFKIQRAGPDSVNLPTAHTCFNTLLLPDYGDDYEKLERLLGRAVLECEGFGLQ